MKDFCNHCRGAQYILAYWLEKMLGEQGTHLMDIPSYLFELIPVENLLFCHCNVQLAFFRRDNIARCQECQGTTWRFTEIAEQAGYRWMRVKQLSQDEIKTLSCEYFERCSCSAEDQSPKSRERKKLLKGVLDLGDIKIPKPSLSF